MGATLESLPCKGCDFCSRLHNQWARFEADVDDVVPLAIRRVSPGDDTDWDDIISSDYSDQPEGAIWLPSYPPEELGKFQQEDPDLSRLIDWLESETIPPLEELYLCSPSVKKFWLNKSQLEFQKGVLYYRWEDNPPKFLLLIPDALKEEIMVGCHDCPTSGHLGQKKTLDRVKRSYMWHELTTDMCLYVRTCPICNKNKKAKTKPKAGLRNFRAGTPMECVHMDILGPFPLSQSGNHYILLMIDQFTKWVEIHAIPEQTAEQTARIAVNQFFTRFGALLQIHTDQGKNFDGQVMKALCSLYRVAKTRATPYHLSSNGQAERYNRLLLQMKERKKMNCHFEPREPPNTVRKQLQALHQEVNESMEEWAEHCQRFAYDAWGDINVEVAELAAVKTFCTGALDSEVVLPVLEKDPSTLDDALEMLKRSVHNHRSVNTRS